MKGSELLKRLRKEFNVLTNRDLALALGLKPAAVTEWNRREECTPLQVARLVHSASKSGALRLRDNAIRPLVEFFEIEECESRHGAGYMLLDANDEEGKPHPYRSGLRTELDSKHGVYLFFDSRGQALYAGKAKRQTLWKEMNLALNRDRGDLQTIKRVKHPEIRVKYQSSDEKARQIVDRSVPIWDLARYFSAYEVAAEMIEDVEALLVRSFANNLLNKRMEQFGRQRRKKSK